VGAPDARVQNVAKREKKQYSFGITLTAPTQQPWRNPVYNVGTWYLAILGQRGSQFVVSVNATKCSPGFVGYVTDRRTWTHACVTHRFPRLPAANDWVEGEA
jgi:hypothetical protein